MSTTYEWFAGIDWGDAHHEVCVMNNEREVVLRRSVKHDGAALAALMKALEELTAHRLERIAVAIETPRGAVVSTLLERQIAVFSINPKQLDRFRDRHTVAGAKDDRRDAFVLADSLRTDTPLYRRVKLGEAKLVELRELVRMHEDLKEEGVRLGNRLRDQLQRYYPQIVELGSVHDESWLLALVERAPTPSRGRRLALAKIGSILQKHGIRRLDEAAVHAVLSKPALVVAAGVVDASVRHVMQLLPRLRLVHEQQREVNASMKKILDELSEGNDDANGREHRDAKVLLSLAGAGTIVCATMLAEASQPLGDRDYRTLRAHCGTAPVTKQSGKTRYVQRRRACNRLLVNAVYFWAMNAIRNDALAKAHYARLRARGHTHGRALRGVADRLLAIAIAMLKKGGLYDPSRRKAA